MRILPNNVQNQFFLGTRTLKNIQKPDINLQVDFNRNENVAKQLP